MFGNYKERAKEIVLKMTIEEKAAMCSGKDTWYLKSFEKYGIDEIMVSDGPSGIRQQTAEGDNLGIGDSVPAVCFPSASATACSFDRDLIYEVGKAMGEECVSQGVSVILGPAVNQKRSPLCGRNFEYFSEDPLLSGEMAASMIQGIQSTGTGTSLKHYAVNNQERRRMTVSAVIDERALRETYLRGFEIAVKKGRPDTVMCCYNKVNSVYGSENAYLLNDILRKEWNFEGTVMSDWGAVHDRVLGVKSGLDLEMPGNDGYNDKKIITAIKNGTLEEACLDQAAENVIALILKSMDHRKDHVTYDVEKHRNIAIKAAAESAVLLKNEGNILPAAKDMKVAVIGEFAKYPRYQGAGSSRMHPIKLDNAWDAINELTEQAVYASGYHKNISSGDDKGRSKKEESEKLIQKAVEIAKKSELVFLFAGLTERYESEGYDRNSMEIPLEHHLLIERVSAVNPNTIVILSGGAPMELPWENKVRAILCGYLGGEGSGKAIAGLLYGKYIPSGKLAETWPIKAEDNPSYKYFPGGRNTVEYRESIYVGYKYYEKANKSVRYAFGHGLSYSEFNYSEMRTDKEHYVAGDKIQVSFSLANIGKFKAKETSLIFFKHQNEYVFMPEKQLCGFVKTELEPGETKHVTVEIDTLDCSYYNTMIHDWYVDGGEYEIRICKTSAQTEIKKQIMIDNEEKPQPNTLNTLPSYHQLKNQVFVVGDAEFEKLYGGSLPLSDTRPKRPFTEENTLEDVQGTLVGKLIGMYAAKVVKNTTASQKEQEGMMEAMIREMPFYAMVASGDGMLSESMMYGILDLLNGHLIRGIKEILK